MKDTHRPASAKVPRGEVRRRELLCEAARILLRDGLDGASMDVIAAEAGASKATLYRHFGDKHGLLVEVVHYLCDDFMMDVDRCPKPGTNLREGLRANLTQLVHVLSKPNHPDFFRLIVTGSQRAPEIGIAWYQYGQLVWQEMLRQVFEQQIRNGSLPRDVDYSFFPEMLFNAVFAKMVTRTAVLDVTVDTKEEAACYLDKLLDVVVGKLMEY